MTHKLIVSVSDMWAWDWVTASVTEREVIHDWVIDTWQAGYRNNNISHRLLFLALSVMKYDKEYIKTLHATCSLQMSVQLLVYNNQMDYQLKTGVHMFTEVAMLVGRKHDLGVPSTETSL